MKRALILALVSMSIGWVTAAVAESPNTSPSPGPHDPNPPMNAPDLRLPPPCAPNPNLAATGGVMSPATATPTTGSRVTPVDSRGDLKCAGNTRAQSAALPGLAPDVQ